MYDKKSFTLLFTTIEGLKDKIHCCGQLKYFWKEQTK